MKLHLILVFIVQISVMSDFCHGKPDPSTGIPKIMATSSMSGIVTQKPNVTTQVPGAIKDKQKENQDAGSRTNTSGGTSPKPESHNTPASSTGKAVVPTVTGAPINTKANQTATKPSKRRKREISLMEDVKGSTNSLSEKATTPTSVDTSKDKKARKKSAKRGKRDIDLMDVVDELKNASKSQNDTTSKDTSKRKKAAKTRTNSAIRSKRDVDLMADAKACTTPLTKAEADEVLKPYDIKDGEFCKGDDFHCNETNTCVSYLMLCDGVEDCPSADDERECNDFKCGDNLSIINRDLICNGCVDCLDGSDESNCDDKPERFCMNYESCFLCGDGTVSCRGTS